MTTTALVATAVDVAVEVWVRTVEFSQSIFEESIFHCVVDMDEMCIMLATVVLNNNQVMRSCNKSDDDDDDVRLQKIVKFACEHI